MVTVNNVKWGIFKECGYLRARYLRKFSIPEITVRWNVWQRCGSMAISNSYHDVKRLILWYSECKEVTDNQHMRCGMKHSRTSAINTPPFVVCYARSLKLNQFEREWIVLLNIWWVWQTWIQLLNEGFFKKKRTWHIHRQ